MVEYNISIKNRVMCLVITEFRKIKMFTTCGHSEIDRINRCMNLKTNRFEKYLFLEIG